MPILHGDRFIGRVNPRFDRDRGALVIEGLWLDKGIGEAPVNGEVPVYGEVPVSEEGLSGQADLGARVKEALWDLARFIGAEELALLPPAQNRLQ